MSDTVNARAARAEYSRSRPESAKQPDGGPSERADRDIQCRQCRVINPGRSRYCRDCGGTLWKECPGCQADRPVDETFCACCGKDMVFLERELIRQSEQRLAEIREMVNTSRLNDALSALNRLAVGQNHVCLQHVKQVTEQLISEISERRQQIADLAVEAGWQADLCLQQHLYADAIAQLERVPEPLRDESVQRRLARATGALEEIGQLKSDLRDSNGGGLFKRLSQVDRLLVLAPDDPQVERWAGQLRVGVIRRAQQQLSRFDYAGALTTLQTTPLALQNEKVITLTDYANELAFLDSELERAPEVTAATIEAGRRLVKQGKNNRPARQALEEMLRRQQAANEQGHRPFIPWKSGTSQSAVDLPVRRLLLPKRLKMANKQVEKAFWEYPGQLFVACGLALQALGLAAVDTNLLRADRVGILKKLRSSLPARPTRQAWGLDLSRTGLKAVCLVVDVKTETVVVRDAVFRAHRLPAGTSTLENPSLAILAETLALFRRDHAVEGGSKIAIQIPTRQLLCRTITVPGSDEKKTAELIRFEARHQIPFPPDEVRWDAALLGDTAHRDMAQQREVLLLALRRNDLSQQLDLWRANDWDPHVVQCDGVALHNFVVFERRATWRKQSRSNSASATAVLDIGADSTNLLLSSADSLRLRGTSPAGDDVTRALVREFNATRAVAEQLKREPQRASRMSKVNAACQRVYGKLLGELQRSLIRASGNDGSSACDQLLLVGGGALSPGLLRYLLHGK